VIYFFGVPFAGGPALLAFSAPVPEPLKVSLVILKVWTDGLIQAFFPVLIAFISLSSATNRQICGD